MDFTISNDATRSLVVANGDFVLTPDTETFLAQKLRIKYSTAEGEWYLDESNGLDWFGTIFVKGQSPDAISDHIKVKTFEEPEVSAIQQFEISQAGVERRITIFARILTNSGGIAELEVTN